MLIKTTEQDSGLRLDKVLARRTGITRSRILKLFETGNVLIDGEPARPSQKTIAGIAITLNMPKAEPSVLMPEDLGVPIIYRDDSLVVVDKPPSMIVHPGAGHTGGTLMNALLFSLKTPGSVKTLTAVGGPLRPGVVHRLDKDTSGLMVVALNDAAYYDLVRQFKDRSVQKQYTALVFGAIKGGSGEITARIGRSLSDRKKMSTRSRKKREAITRWEVLKRLPGATLLCIGLKTGRTHQIRVHFASVGHPVLGDRTYGKKTALHGVPFKRQMLHSFKLGFIHPASGEHMEFQSPLPPDMDEAIAALQAQA